MGNMILDEIRLDDIKHDPWGTALSWWFDIADVLHAEGAVIPSGWGFSPGLGATRELEFSNVADMWVAGYVDADDLRYAGNVLARFVRIAEVEGRSY